MIERRKHRDRRAIEGAGLVDAWASIGPVVRIIFSLAIISCFLWSLKAIFEMVLWLRVLLG